VNKTDSLSVRARPGSKMLEKKLAITTQLFLLKMFHIYICSFFTWNNEHNLICS